VARGVSRTTHPNRRQRKQGREAVGRQGRGFSTLWVRFALADRLQEGFACAIPCVTPPYLSLPRNAAIATSPSLRRGRAGRGALGAGVTGLLLRRAVSKPPTSYPLSGLTLLSFCLYTEVNGV
jgi:hypothetical protein